ncbi:MAG: hypothetical protein DRP11_04860 [Candidatus Aenigmatarchaeota archaeon]|nr:MAG: hypothetical protein DRP11_04860 [Candidatus Aenigmarchaeota archaeon]
MATLFGHMPEKVITGETVFDVLEKANEFVRKHGKVHIIDQAGRKERTWDCGNMLLVVENPFSDRYGFSWSRKEDEWYQDVFVRKSGFEGRYVVEYKGKRAVLPYLYKQQFRFSDCGLGEEADVLEALMETNNEDVILREFLIHPQVLRGVLESYREKGVNLEKMKKEEVLTALRNESKIKETDQIETVIRRFLKDRNTRRAFITSHVQPHLLRHREAVYPYSWHNFYIREIDGERVMVSTTGMRSNDMARGTQLDLNHNIDWAVEVKTALEKNGIEVDRILVALFTNSAHIYEPREENIFEWLVRVTHGKML